MRKLGLLVVSLVSVIGSACSTKDEAASEMPSEPDTSVYDQCVDFATRLCADAQPCCERAYGGFDAEACVASFRRDVCRPGADAVTAGKASYDESAVDACLAAHAEAHAVCIPSWKQTLELRKHIYAACRVIDGTSKPGSGCSISATCEHPAGDATVSCVKNVCQAIEVLPEGAQCPFPSGSVSVCDDGLACDADGPDTTGHCRKAIAEGEPCNAGVLEGTECGLGSFCDAQSGTCRLASNTGGPGCEQSTECVSFDCNRLENACEPAPAVITRETCLGQP